MFFSTNGRALLTIAFLSMLTACSTPANIERPELWQKGDYAPAIIHLDDMLQTELDIGDIVGLNIALVDDQSIIWQQGFGYSDIDADEYAAESSRYRTAEVSQLVTAIALMQLIDEGKASLDQPLVEILPEFSVNSRFDTNDAITLRNLLSHQSGLPADLLGSRDLKFTQVLPSVSKMSASFPPNTMRANSNIGYSLIGLVIEKLSGQSFESYISNKVLSPLGMNNSRVQRELQIAAYREGGQVQEPTARDTPSLGLVSSAVDLAQLAKLLHRSGDGVLSASAFSEMLPAQNMQQPLDLQKPIGLGWQYIERVLPSMSPVVGHEGKGYAHRAILLTSLEHKISVILLSNTAEASDSLKRLATDSMHYALAAKNGTYPSLYTENSSKPVTDKPLSGRALASKLEGDYASIAGLVKVRQSKNGQLTMETLGRELDLVTAAKGAVKPEYRLMGMSFTLPGDYSMMNIYPGAIAEHELLLGDIEGEKLLLGKKITAKPYPSSLQQYFGQWLPASDAATVAVEIAGIKIHEQDGYLTSSLSTTSGTTLHYPLQAISDSRAVAMGLGPQLGESFRFYQQDGQLLLDYSGLIFTQQ